MNTKTITMEEMLEMSMEYQVPISRVICGYLRAPRGRDKDHVWGYCSLFQRDCKYEIPLIKCEAEQEWLKNK